MTQTLAEVLSGINDPHTIKTILTAAGVDDISDDELASASKSPSLNELYNRFLQRRENRSPSTRAQYKRTIPEFVEFANEQGITSPTAVGVEITDSFVDELQTVYESDSTVLTYTKNVRAWLKWVSQRGLCDDSVYKILDKDELGLTPRARDEALPAPKAMSILEELREKRRGTAKHALMELMWNGGPRIGGVHSIDVDDFLPEKSELKFRHRPDQGTRLKNGSEGDDTPGDGERNVELKDEVVESLNLYIQHDRPPVTDEYGREPLFATKQGRAAKSTIRRWVYEATSCRWGRNEKQLADCDGSCDPDSNVCTYSYYPHAIRRGAIVNHLSNGLRLDRASERFDVSIGTMKKHYDPRTKHQKKEDRKEAVRNAWE